jgi:OPA family sugar phosphate sensor protein UhpC-like MFS transporter
MAMNFLNIFKPAPYIEEIQDEEVVKKKYKYWRLRTFYGMYIGYAFYYFTRKSFCFAMPAMQETLGMSKFELGLLGSILYISYGASKFLSGMLADKSNPRYFMSIGLILTGLFNVLFGLSSLWWAFAIFWGLNGCFQGWGSPGCAKLLTHWYSQSERGRWWGFWNTSLNVGGILTTYLVAGCIQYFGWRSAMYVPGLLSICMGLFVMNRLRDTPQSMGLPPIEKFRNDSSSLKTSTARSNLSVKEILFKYVLCNKLMWVLGVSYLFVYIIRTGINDWSMFYLIEVKGYTPLQAGLCVSWFEIGGAFGGLAAGWISDSLFNSRRNPANIMFTVGILGLLLAFRAITTVSPVCDIAFIFLFGFFIFGPQMLIGIAAAELSHKNAAATATGFVGIFAYVGAAFAGGPLGAITKHWGWDGFFVALIGCTVLAIFLMLPLWSVKTNAETTFDLTPSAEEGK